MFRVRACNTPSVLLQRNWLPNQRPNNNCHHNNIDNDNTDHSKHNHDSRHTRPVRLGVQTQWMCVLNVVILPKWIL